MNKPCREYSHVPERYENFNMKIILAMKEVIIKELLENKDGVKLPSGLGALKIMRFIPENQPVDRWATKVNYEKLGRVIRYTNDHTDGYVFKLFWFRDSYAKSVGFPTSKIFKFKDNVSFKKALLKYVKNEDWVKFDISPSTLTINPNTRLSKTLKGE